MSGGPLSAGGSGLVPEGKLPLRQALWVGIVTTLAALAIGIYFVFVCGRLLIPAAGRGDSMPGFLYARYSEDPLAGVVPRDWDWASCPCWVSFSCRRGEYRWVVLVASIPSGILVHNLLLLNEFPDVEADRMGGRKTTPVLFGMEAAGRLFRVATISVYAWIAGCVLVTILTGCVVMPVYCLIGIPSHCRWRGTPCRVPGNMRTGTSWCLPSASNVMFILATHVLLGIGYILERLFPIS